MKIIRFSLLMLLLVPGLLLAESPDLARAAKLYGHTDYAGAIRLLSSVPVKTPAVNELLGQCYCMSGDFKKATEYLERAFSAEPRNSVYLMWLGRVYGRRAETSFAFSAVSWASKSRSSLEKAIELDPTNWEAIDDLFDFYVEAPAIVGGGLDRAEKLAVIIARRDPAEAFYDRARIAEARKQYDAEEQHLRKAAELAPHQVGRWLELGKFFARRGRYDESDKYFAQADKFLPGAPKVYFVEATTYIKTNRNVSTAKVLLQKYLNAADLTPDDPPKSEAQKLLKRIS